MTTCDVGDATADCRALVVVLVATFLIIVILVIVSPLVNLIFIFQSVHCAVATLAKPPKQALCVLVWAEFEELPSPVVMLIMPFSN